MHGPIGHGPFGPAGHVFGAIVGVLGSVVFFAIVVAVLFFLIRFLIVGTKAAQLYLDRHRAAPAPGAVAPAAAAPATPAASPAVATPAAPAATQPAATPAAKPAPRPRTPRTPPTPKA